MYLTIFGKFTDTMITQEKELRKNKECWLSMSSHYKLKKSKTEVNKFASESIRLFTL